MPDTLHTNSEPIDFVNLFFDKTFWETLQRETNRRAKQVKEEKPDSYYAKVFRQIESIDEIKAFVGVRIQMEFAVIKRRYADYWNLKPMNPIAYTPGFKEVFPRDQWLAIWTFLHTIDENDQNIDKTDKIYKNRKMLNDLLVKFRYFYKPGEFLSLDEGMIPTKNRLSIKQYIRDKPVKFGIKCFMLTDAETGYIVNGEIYTGREEILEPCLGATGNVVKRLIEDSNYDKKGHIVVMDRFYNSVILYNHLYTEMDTFAVGTAMTNRKFYPGVLNVKNTHFRNRGEFDFLCRQNITCMVWQDRKPINFISNIHDPADVGQTNRRLKTGELVEVPMPSLVKDYNKFMGGCDKNDQLTRLNRTRRHYRWPRRMFVKLFMWGLYNAFVLHTKFRPRTTPTRKKSFQYFIDKVCLSLVGNFKSPIPRRRRLCQADRPLRLRNVGEHFPTIPEGASYNRRCVVCAAKYNNYKKENPRVAYKDYPFKYVKSQICCSKCDVSLCVRRGSTCWQDWHTKINYAH